MEHRLIHFMNCGANGPLPHSLDKMPCMGRPSHSTNYGANGPLSHSLDSLSSEFAWPIRSSFCRVNGPRRVNGSEHISSGRPFLCTKQKNPTSSRTSKVWAGVSFSTHSTNPYFHTTSLNQFQPTLSPSRGRQK